MLAPEDGFDPRSARVKFVDKMALGEFSFPVIQFLLSVSFHPCSIPIDSSTTDAL